MIRKHWERFAQSIFDKQEELQRRKDDKFKASKQIVDYHTKKIDNYVELSEYLYNINLMYLAIIIIMSMIDNVWMKGTLIVGTMLLYIVTKRTKKRVSK